MKYLSYILAGVFMVATGVQTLYIHDTNVLLDAKDRRIDALTKAVDHHQAQDLVAVAVALPALRRVAGQVVEVILHVLVRVLVALGGGVPWAAEEVVDLREAVHEKRLREGALGERDAAGPLACEHKQVRPPCHRARHCKNLKIMLIIRTIEIISGYLKLKKIFQFR